MRNITISKRLSLLLILFMATSIFAVSSLFDGEIDAATTYGTVKSGPLNVRSGPGTNYSKVGSVSKGTKITITGSKNDSKGAKWYTFTYNGKISYVHSSYVTVSSNTQTYSTNKSGTVNAGPLNVRSGPGTNYSKLGSLTKGKSVSVKGLHTTASGSKWYTISYNGKTGYLSTSYVTISSTSTSTESSSSSSEEYNPAKTGTVKLGPLNVRSGAGTNYGVIGSLAKSKTITITGLYTNSSGKWYRTTINGKTGYVSAGYITISSTSTSTTEKYNPTKKGQATAAVNVRSGPSTSNSKVGLLAKNATITLYGLETKNGSKWYKISYNSKTAYVSADYIKLIATSTGGDSVSSTDFEAYMTAQGFPESYKPYLRNLHKKHPNWVFKAQNTGTSWSTAKSKQSVLGRSLVSSASPSSYKSTASGAYNSSTGKYTVFDGSWNQASDAVIGYYLDPRNFLTEDGIYQFLNHKFNSSYQTKDTIKSQVNRNGCFMNKTSYIDSLYNAGRNSGVNPNVLTGMVIMEQGWRGGSGLISGTNPKFPGYYNHFNIGAYYADGMTSIERGLWWVKGAGVGATSYGRPWNTVEKSLTGGVSFYKSNYINNNQHTYYTKRFNVMNGASNMGLHQYSTAIHSAAGEGTILKYAYASNDNYPMEFYIPVYTSIPSSLSKLP